MPASSLHVLPYAVDPVLGALVEPGGNALRAAEAAAVGAGDRALVLGPGTIGLLVAMFLRAAGAEVHVMGRSAESLAVRPRASASPTPGRRRTSRTCRSTPSSTPRTPRELPALALDLVEPAGRVVYIGLAGEPSRIDTRTLVLEDVTAVGILSASPGLARAIEAFATGAVDPRPLVAATVGLHDVAAVLAGERPAGAGPGPKIHVDPRLSSVGPGRRK